MAKRQLGIWFMLVASYVCVAQDIDYNALGSDPTVNYNQLYQESLERGLPWDTRNLDLRAEDLALLPPDDSDDNVAIPLWFRVQIRRNYPQMRASGPRQYPHSVKEVYRIFYMPQREDAADKTATLNGEVNVTGSRYGSETAIAINPVNPSIIVAGANGPTGQEMFRSLDGGATWTRSTSDLGASCCDPTVAWSPDGSIAYMSQLGNCSLVCNIEFFTSTDNGLTWGNKVTIQDGNTSDKPYIHVDISPSSPYLGRVYAHYHNFNTIEFAYSTDNGASFSTPQAFNSTLGIAGDITTDTSGKIYHVWTNFGGTNAMRMNRSTDGGVTFGPITTVATTNAVVDYTIPAMDNRLVLIYASLGADLSNGPYRDRVYLLYSDISGTQFNKHSVLKLGYSDDGGDSWTFVTPHPTDDINLVDRFNPWLDVDGDGTVHIVYYSTQNDVNRLKPDLYHAYSNDGGTTWSAPLRVTGTSSNYINDGFQWGDYNGLSVVDGQVRPIWTDNRNGIRGYTADLELQLGDFTIAASGAGTTAVCAGETSNPLTLQLAPLEGFSAPLTLSLVTPPQDVTAIFSQNPVTAPATPSLQFQTGASSPEGYQSMTVQATGGGRTHDITLQLGIRTLNLPGLSPLWREPTQFNGLYDFDTDGAITVRDLVAGINCLPQP